MKNGFANQVRSAFSGTDAGQQRAVLTRTRVPDQWEAAIRQVYGCRWDEHPGAKERGLISQRAYLACESVDWGWEAHVTCPLWGEYDREYEKRVSENVRNAVDSIKVKVFNQEDDTEVEERRWAVQVFADWVIPRVRALMGLPSDCCPCCGKKFPKPSCSCECGFPEIDPVDYIKDYVAELRGARAQGKMLVADYAGYVGTNGQYKDRYCYNVSNGKYWWQEVFEVEGKNVFERYGAKGYVIFASRAKIGECIHQLIPPQPQKKSEMGENVHHVRVFGVTKVVDPADEYLIIGTISSESSCDYIWSGRLKAGKSYNVFLAGSKAPVVFSLEDTAGLRVQWFAFEFRPPDWTKCIRVELPEDMEQLQAMDGREVNPGDCLPIGMEFRISGGQRNGETFVVRE